MNQWYIFIYLNRYNKRHYRYRYHLSIIIRKYVSVKFVDIHYVIFLVYIQ